MWSPHEAERALHTTITFLSLRPLHFLSFYLQPKPRRSQMWRNVTPYDRWVCVWEPVCVCTLYVSCCLFAPDSVTFLCFMNTNKKLVPKYCMAAPHRCYTFQTSFQFDGSTTDRQRINHNALHTVCMYIWTNLTRNFCVKPFTVVHLNLKHTKNLNFY